MSLDRIKTSPWSPREKKSRRTHGQKVKGFPIFLGVIVDPNLSIHLLEHPKGLFM